MSVEDAEKIVAKSGLIHKYCLSCNECRCNLDASSFFNGADGEVSEEQKVLLLGRKRLGPQ